MLKLRKVELLGFKSFCEKTHLTFSGSGISCIVGPNGCGKSNVVDAISWVLGEQSHKMLRAERMADCIFNGTAKRPPMGLAEVALTLIDPELSLAAAKVLEGAEETAEAAAAAAGDPPADLLAEGGPEAETTEGAVQLDCAGEAKKPWKKRAAEKPAAHLKPGEVTVGRRLYRSGQSEYLINGRVARLRDVQELFMGMGLGPDSYAIIEQGRIGMILNSKPMERRAIIEEAAGITMYKTKRRLAEAKLEASKINLARVNDILVEVEKQLASLKRQASRARRYAELREQMRRLLRTMLASKAQHLDIEAARLEQLLRGTEAAERREAHSVHELEAEQERLSARSYELDSEIRQMHNLLGQTALDLDRAENRIVFNREQAAQIDSRTGRLALEIEQGERQAAELIGRVEAQRQTVRLLQEQTAAVESILRQAAENATAGTAEQQKLETRIEDLRQLAARAVEKSAREQAKALQAEEAAGRHAAAEKERTDALRNVETEFEMLAARATAAEFASQKADSWASALLARVQATREKLAELRQAHQETAQRLEGNREELSAERARRFSIEQILQERAYTADAVQRLFHANGEGQERGFRAVGLLADYAEVPEEHESAIEQFLRDELEYVVVESFDHARAGIALLREETGGRATFFVDSLRNVNARAAEADVSLPVPEGALARLDRLVEFRDPLGPAAKQFFPKLRSAFLVETAATAERLADEDPEKYFLTLDGTCYHGRMVTGGRPGEAGPLALKRELRRHEAEAQRLERLTLEEQAKLSRLKAEIAEGEERLLTVQSEHVEAEKGVVAAQHQFDQARADFRRVEQQLAAGREEIARLHAEAEFAREATEQARAAHAEALHSRQAAETEAAEAIGRLAALRQQCQALLEDFVARREELAMTSERLASAETAELRLKRETASAAERVNSLRQEHAALVQEKAGLASTSAQLAVQVEDLRREKLRLEERRVALERGWEEARQRGGQIEESLRAKRQTLEELRADRSQRQIEKARNEADRDYLRQTCVAELNAQPEELMALEARPLIGEELIAAETSYNEMKARVEAIGPVNMMALEEYKECEERENFLRRERDDLMQSIENTQLAIHELDQVSQQKFDEAFQAINRHFAVAFQTLFGGGTGEMRLSEPDSSGESGLDIVAQPPGKRLQNILLLSGGEKALTALGLLIAVFRYQPSPFCILDEVDAPLDEANVGRFNKLLEEMTEQTQFIVVTHNRKTMETGAVLYGVTMQEPGVSKLVSVRWEDAEPATNSPAANSAG